ncbi:rhodanese-like domain-containing protein [Aquibacillus salsiterrae]|uniref:Rhodanese-like domain-containing protein n=1 Tax=Aquibacillus salsiterrae TaxID=2950439 RepID=A0A9X4AFI7_9BACI|nr:rhodanese-like domain-containing protein [Aquibacillus salsiterrae]MDC3416245.1 rhodanese-like domain-containing protein [Aquibacillus salsiterrae]
MEELTPKEVEVIVKEGKDYTIVDVREDEEVAAGIIPNAVHIPLGLVEEKVEHLDKHKDYILVCRSGRRSEMACMFMEAKGFKVSNMVGGMLEWEGPTEINK